MLFTVGDVFCDERGAEYRVARELGAGGQGAAYGVVRVADGAPLVLKHMVLGADIDALAKRTRMIVNAQLAVNCSPALAAPIATVQVAVGVAYVMPFARGASLEDLLVAAPWSFAERIELAAALCAVVTRLHACRAVHADLSARNVYVEQGADGLWRPMLIDLDNLGHAQLAVGPMSGTPEYMAVETLTASLQGKSVPTHVAGEQFALGVLVHEILRGQHPFLRGPTDAPSVIAQRLSRKHEEWRSAPGAPPADLFSSELRQLFDRALGPDPAARVPADEWMRALTRARRDLYSCVCGAVVVNDATRKTCPMCGRLPDAPRLVSNLGQEYRLDEPVLELGVREFPYPDISAPHVRVAHRGYAVMVTDVSERGTHLVGTRGLARLPPGEAIELRLGDRVRLGGSVELSLYE